MPRGGVIATVESWADSLAAVPSASKIRVQISLIRIVLAYGFFFGAPAGGLPPLTGGFPAPGAAVGACGSPGVGAMPGIGGGPGARCIGPVWAWVESFLGRCAWASSTARLSPASYTR